MNFSGIKVLAGAPCGKTPVCDSFYDCFYGLLLPEGSIKIRAKSGSVPQNLNALVDQATKHECTHLFIVEDDSMFAPDTVLRLLSHDKDVVTGLCLQRNPPFRPYIYDGFDPAVGLIWRNLNDGESGLIKVAATGMGGILIKMDVFKRLERPYFSTFYTGEKEWGQDIIFQSNLFKAGVETFCDLDATIWHATHCSLGTEFVDGKWWTLIRIEGFNVRLPQVAPGIEFVNS
jgi:hypothetical protein